MPELREDLTTKDWVVFATERARRPHDFQREQSHAATLPARAADCPFCPGNESQTPGEIDRLVLVGAPDWSVRVVPNRFAAFVPDGDPHRSVHADHFRSMQAIGAHEVVIETPHHARAIPDMSDAEITLVFAAYQRRYRALRRLAGMEVVIIFKNYGEAAGTSLTHPHSQIVAAPVQTRRAKRAPAMDTNTLGAYCRQQRERQGIRRSQLAAMIGYKNISKGARQIHRFETDGEIQRGLLD